MHPTVSDGFDMIQVFELPDSPAPDSSLTRGSFSEISAPSLLDARVSGELPEVPEDSNSKLLLLAARAKSADLVRYHVTRENVNGKDSRQRTALHLVLHGAVAKDAIPILLEHGADVNAKDDYGTNTSSSVCRIRQRRHSTRTYAT